MGRKLCKCSHSGTSQDYAINGSILSYYEIDDNFYFLLNVCSFTSIWGMYLNNNQSDVFIYIFHFIQFNISLITMFIYTFFTYIFGICTLQIRLMCKIQNLMLIILWRLMPNLYYEYSFCLPCDEWFNGSNCKWLLILTIDYQALILL